tara:strand:- start:48942 stop:49766 length:825 start_codon:yes stop_codon:yes gene_type:complete
MSKALFNKISIIESLGRKDRKTGSRLYEDISMLEVFHGRGVDIELKTIQGKVDLFTYIDGLVCDAKTKRKFPVLQIDAHGSRLGIVLGSNETVSWRELCDKLRVLNTALRGNLIIVMASCYGCFITGGVDLFDRAPFWGLMSPLNEVYSDDIEKDLRKFYESIFKGDSDNGSIPKQPSFNLITVENVFLEFWKIYLDNQAPNDLLTQHAKLLYTQKKKNNPNLKIEDLRESLLSTGKSRLLYQLNFFLFTDIEPYNLERVRFKSSDEIIEHFNE